MTYAVATLYRLKRDQNQKIMTTRRKKDRIQDELDELNQEIADEVVKKDQVIAAIDLLDPNGDHDPANNP